MTNRFSESVSAGQVDPPSLTAGELEKESLLEAVKEAIQQTAALIEALKEVEYLDPMGSPHFTRLSRPGANHITNFYVELAYLDVYLGWLAEDLDNESND